MSEGRSEGGCWNVPLQVPEAVSSLVKWSVIGRTYAGNLYESYITRLPQKASLHIYQGFSYSPPGVQMDSTGRQSREREDHGQASTYSRLGWISWTRYVFNKRPLNCSLAWARTSAPTLSCMYLSASGNRARPTADFQCPPQLRLSGSGLLTTPWCYSPHTRAVVSRI